MNLSHSRFETGMALVVVLAFVVLVTMVVVAFFALATSNRITESSRTHRTQAELLARTAGEHTIGNFLDEIQNTSLSTLTNGVYLPSSATNSVPRRILSTGIPSHDGTFFNLIRQSTSAAEPLASSHSTGVAARNGRVVPPRRWNLPALLEGDGFSETAQLPNWIYVTSNGGLTNSPSDGVIGRFAYNVYDIGGLLNANVAGYPADLSSEDLATVKGLPGGASLDTLGISPDAIAGLLAFRNPDSSSNPDLLKKNIAAQIHDGFLSLVNSESTPSFTNNYFDSRQDLLRYALVENPGLAPALPFLTHFSRSLAAPSWHPSAVTSANPVIPGVRFTTNATITHYRDDGSVETYQVSAGDPLMQRRFSLARLAWFTPSGPAAGISPSAIRAVFGLAWNSDDERWDFVGSDSGSSALDSIPTLAEVATRNREPNFFEILKAGILEGSLGQFATSKTLAGASAQLLEANKDFQILRIGACIMDQADSDNYPTILALSDDREAAGVEDLPYFHLMNMIVLRQTDTSQTPNKLTHADVIWAPVFFNPHQLSSSTASPNEVVMDIARGELLKIQASSGSELIQDLTKDLSSLPAISLPAADFERFRPKPLPAENSTAFNRLGSLVPYATGDTNVQSLKLFSYQDEYTAAPWPADRPVSANAIFRITLNDLLVHLRYRTPSGNLKTYATLGGHEAIPGSGLDGMPHATQGMVIGIGPSFPISDPPTARLQQSNFSLSYYASLWDPRTSRLGPSYGQTRTISDAPAISGTADRIRGGTPFSYTDSNSVPVLPALWPQGERDGEGPGFHSNFADPDGKFRPADGWLGNDANPYRSLSDSSRRPVILQRPFQSVGELGYAFRDSPWKSLDFFDESSGDAALLDLFSVKEEAPITAGRTHLATRQLPVLQSLLQQTAWTPDHTSLLNSSTARSVADAFRSRNYASDGTPTTQLADNPGKLPSFLSADLSADLPILKYQREAISRALASGTQTRTWNLLIDLVAQTGKFQGGSAEGDFIVEGEKRYWLSVAMDRLTSRVIAEQWEAVYE